MIHKKTKQTTSGRNSDKISNIGNMQTFKSFGFPNQLHKKTLQLLSPNNMYAHQKNDDQMVILLITKMVNALKWWMLTSYFYTT